MTILTRNRMRFARLEVVLIGAMVVALAGCGRGEQRGSEQPDTATKTSPPSTSGAVTPAPGGKVITVEMETQPDGSNVFEPAMIDARRGDVLRYVLVSGVHNVHFLPDSNPGKSNLPPASAMLQLPGQTLDIPVALAPGTYYFQCDPHALLGMIAHVTVTE